MSRIDSIKLLGDSTVSVPLFNPQEMPNLAFKHTSILLNGEMMADSTDPDEREAFAQSLESVPKLSFDVKQPTVRWADFLAEQFLTNDACFVFSPSAELYPEYQSEIQKAQVVQKTQYADFFAQNNRPTGKLVSLEVPTGNWLCGISLIMWQAQKLLQSKDPEESVSLTKLKALFEQISQRTVTFSLISIAELNGVARDALLHENLMSRIGGTLGKSQWFTHEMCKDNAQIIEKGELSGLIDQMFISLMTIIERKALAFNRIIICCTHQQLEMLKETLAFQQIDQMQGHWNFKWVHQVPSITAQALTGKSAIHISCANKELLSAGQE
ncbi:hypothetical protein [Reinekea blandensis]|uniref:Dihydrolipoamide acetyltransferase n=1 Tax=Reinekea blandensis MED297 TaxID=314283 RepID=A4BGM3_9GAMM|nr:hypothetical protein [Reinekea blandensis]EAR08671.1 dihydrolipoamide acetyltransferase [Reinekea sp. MED297] [Reinekea blandensis MED297]